MTKSDKHPWGNPDKIHAALELAQYMIRNIPKLEDECAQPITTLIETKEGRVKIIEEILKEMVFKSYKGANEFADTGFVLNKIMISVFPTRTEAAHYVRKFSGECLLKKESLFRIVAELRLRTDSRLKGAEE